MRKPRDIDSELSALAERTKLLKAKRVRQFGELVTSTGADALPVEILAGSLLAIGEATDTEREAWRERGAAFFQKGGNAARRTRTKPGAGAARAGSAQPSDAGEGAA
jgi:DNA-binding protein H-NS